MVTVVAAPRAAQEALVRASMWFESFCTHGLRADKLTLNFFQWNKALQQGDCKWRGCAPAAPLGPHAVPNTMHGFGVLLP